MIVLHVKVSPEVAKVSVLTHE
eukprot:COSAG06_NODE_26230_length_619_cov_0.790385_1_plen_21_part_10